MMSSQPATPVPKQNSLWKRGSINVPGRPKLKSASKSKAADADSFQNFTESVSDAWDIGDDEFCNLSIGDMIISPGEVHSAALSVLESHKQSTLSVKPNACTDAGKAEALQRLAMKDAVPRLPDHVIHPKHYPGFPRPIGQGSTAVRTSSESETSSEALRIQKFQTILFEGSSSINMEELKKLSWSGVPSAVRPDVWRLLSDYVPPNRDRWESVATKKREEYWNYVENYYKTRSDEQNGETYRQIHIDIPRMAPLMPLFQQPLVQEILERILFIWAIRHPASGYVQGINDLVTPFFVVFISEHVERCLELTSNSPPNVDKVVSAEALRSVEADTFWGFSHLLSGIQDHYTFAQPGIQKRIHQLADLVQRVDKTLHAHIARHDIDYLQFAFRWMNNLLTRELSLQCTLRLWDTCLVEPQGFGLFYLYICAAFLFHWRDELLRQMDFQSLMLLLQNLPTKDWTPKEIEVLTAEAYRLKYVFDGAPNHLAK